MGRRWSSATWGCRGWTAWTSAAPCAGWPSPRNRRWSRSPAGGARTTAAAPARPASTTTWSSRSAPTSSRRCCRTWAADGRRRPPRMSARHRRWLPSAVAAALVALAVAAPHGRAAAPALSRSAPPIVTRKLPNGLTVILVEDRRAPLVSVVALYRAGSADDPPDRPGLAHLLEHAVIEGAPPIARAAREGQGEGLYLTTGLTTVDETFYRQEVRTGEVAVALWREAMRLTAFERRADVERALPLAAESVINEEGGRVDRSPLLDGIRAATALFLGQQHPYAISLGSE